MKNMFACLIALLALCVLAPAQTTTTTVSSYPVSISGFYDFTTHKPIVAGVVPLYSVPNFLLQNWTLSFDVFGGTASNGVITGGTALGFSHPLDKLSGSFKNLNFTVGLGEAIYQGGTTHLVGFIGIKGAIGSL